MEMCFIIQTPKNVSGAPPFTCWWVGFPQMQVKLSRICGNECRGDTFIWWNDKPKDACVCRVWAFARQPMWARADACLKTFLCSTHNSTAFCPAKDSRSIIKPRNGTLHWKLVEQADTSTFHKILTLQTWRSAKSKYTTAVVSTKWAAQLAINVVDSSLKIIFG